MTTIELPIRNLSSAPALVPHQPPLIARLLNCPWASMAAILLLACAATFHGWRTGRVFVPTECLADSSAIVDQETRQFATEQVPWTTYAAARWRKSQVPLWNPYDGLGKPLVGNGASAVFFPTMLLHMYLPATWAWTLGAALKLFVAGAGVWILARRYRLSGPGRLFAAAAFMLCTFNVGRVNFLEMNVVPLLPWAILLAVLLIDRVTPIRMLIAALIFAIQFLGGRPEASLGLLLTVAAVWAVHLIIPLSRKEDQANEKQGGWMLGFGRAVAAGFALLAALAAGALAAGIQWVPTLEHLRELGTECFRDLRGPLVISEYLPTKLVEIVYPSLGKMADGSGAWIGTIGVVLAIIGIASAWRNPRALTWTILAAVAIALLLYAQPLIIRHLPRFPGLIADQSPSLLASIALALAMLAGVGLDELLAPLNGKAKNGGANATLRAGLASVETMLGVALMAAVAVLALIAPIKVKTFWPVVPGVMLAGLAMLLWMARTGAPKTIAIFSLAAIVLAGGELLWKGIPLNPGASATSCLPANPAVEELRSRLKLGSPFRFTADNKLVPAGVSAGLGVPDLRGTDAFILPRMHPWMAENVPSTTRPTTRPVGMENLASRLLGIRYAIISADAVVPDGWRKVFPVESAESSVSIIETPTARPRAWLVGPPTYDRITAAALGSANFDPQRTLLIDPDAPEMQLPDMPLLQGARPIEGFLPNREARSIDRGGMGSRRPGGGRSQQGVLRASPLSSSASFVWLEDSPERIRIKVTNPGGWLVLADAFAPGWRAKLRYTVIASDRKPEYTFDREPTLAPAYGSLRAAPLLNTAQIGLNARLKPDIEVVFEYAPRPWRRAWLVSSAGLALLLVLGAWSLFPALKRP